MAPFENLTGDPQFDVVGRMAADWLSQRVNAPVVTLPFSVGGTPGAKDLYGLFDDSIELLLAVPR